MGVNMAIVLLRGLPGPRDGILVVAVAKVEAMARSTVVMIMVPVGRMRVSAFMLHSRSGPSIDRMSAGAITGGTDARPKSRHQQCYYSAGHDDRN